MHGDTRLALAIALVAVALVIGFWIGNRRAQYIAIQTGPSGVWCADGQHVWPARHEDGTAKCYSADAR